MLVSNSSCVTEISLYQYLIYSKTYVYAANTQCVCIFYVILAFSYLPPYSRWSNAWSEIVSYSADCCTLLCPSNCQLWMLRHFNPVANVLQPSTVLSCLMLYRVHAWQSWETSNILVVRESTQHLCFNCYAVVPDKVAELWCTYKELLRVRHGSLELRVCYQNVEHFDANVQTYLIKDMDLNRNYYV